MSVSPDDTPAPTRARRDAPLARVERAVEQAVEASIAGAERSLARRFGAGCVAALRVSVKAVGVLLLVGYFAFGLLYLGTRHWLMPRIDDWRPQVEAFAGRTLGVRVQIDRIETGWRGIHPHLRLVNVRLFDAAGGVALALPQLEATVSWTSVVALEPRFTLLAIRAPEIEVKRLSHGRFEVAGFVLDPAAPAAEGRLADWVLAQHRIAIRDLRLRYVDAREGAAAPPLLLQEGDFEYRRGLLVHRVALRARPPSALAAAIDLRAEFRHPPLARPGDYSRWSGRLFLQTEYADLAALTALAGLATPFALERGQGALRAWLQFDRLRSERLTADVAAADVIVKLAPAAAPLALASLHGRFTQQALGGAWAGGHEIAFSGLTLATADGLQIAPTDLRLRLAPARGDFEASRLPLDAVTRLAAHLPLAPRLRDEIERRDARGEVTSLRATWNDGATLRYAVRARFARLSMRASPADPPASARGVPRPGLPGFDNLAGSLTLTESGGHVDIDATDAALEFPGVFAAPRIAAKTLKAAVGWSLEPQLELRFESVALANEDLDLTANGTWRATGKGPGALDLVGRITRLRAAAAHAYAPLVLAADVRQWLATAFTAGEAVDGLLRLRGDLADFPFAAGGGDFRVQARMRGIGLAYLPGWPAVSNLDGDLRIERARLQFDGRQAAVSDTRLESIEVRIPNLTHDAHLRVAFKAAGPAGGVLRYLAESPIGGWLGDALARASASGNAATELRLDVPLAHARDTRVQGSVTLTNTDLTLSPELPPLARASGRVEFTEKAFKLVGVSGGFLGGQVLIEGGTRPDGAIAIAASGSATPAGVRRMIDIPFVQRLLERAQGMTRYAANVALRDGLAELHLESDLLGWSIAAPEPLAKAATDALPLRLDIVPAGARADRVRLTLGELLALQFARSGPPAAMRIERGAIRIGEASDADIMLPERGVRAVVNLPRLNVDRWSPLLSGLGRDTAAGGAVASAVPDLIAARIGELVIAGRPIANLVLGATRAPEGDGIVWLANVVSDHATGSVTWHMPRADNPGRVSARLARLAVPEASRTDFADVLDATPSDVPAFDVVADSFEVGARKLGRLELVALNAGGGAAAVWELQRLEISNADARMRATGRWVREAGATARTMALDLALEFSDAGKLLARLGIPDAVRGGEGTLSGRVSWRGAPLAIDYPTLAGHLELAANKGQFLKADAGAGRLLGVLSLQALPRRLALDFRDVFSEGFAFDAITARADVAAGVLTTRDFRMRGANATVLMEGSTDLRAETQNLHVLVLPEVNVTSASLVYALLANPAVGLGTFLAQLLLREPLAKAFSFEYDITGSWQDPQVKRRERANAATGETNPEAR